MRLRGGRGEVTGAVILLPLVVTMVFLVIHAALVYHARSIVAAAAEDAARAAQVEDGSAAEGRAVAGALLEGSAGLIPDPVVTRGADRDHGVGDRPRRRARSHPLAPRRPSVRAPAAPSSASCRRANDERRAARPG